MSNICFFIISFHYFFSSVFRFFCSIMDQCRILGANLAMVRRSAIVRVQGTRKEVIVEPLAVRAERLRAEKSRLAGAPKEVSVEPLAVRAERLRAEKSRLASHAALQPEIVSSSEPLLAQGIDDRISRRGRPAFPQCATCGKKYKTTQALVNHQLWSMCDM